MTERNEDTPAPAAGHRSTLADHPTIKGILPSFIARQRGNVCKLRELMAAQDGEGLRRLAHQIRGAGASYGFPEIGNYAREIEKAIGPTLPFAECIPHVERLVQYLENIEGYKSA